MKQKITKSKVIQNCIKIGAGLVVAGGIGFQVHENHELNTELTALNQKHTQVVQNLKSANQKITELEGLNKNLSQQKNALQQDHNQALKTLKDAKKENEKLNKKINSLESILLNQKTVKASAKASSVQSTKKQKSSVSNPMVAQISHKKSTTSTKQPAKETMNAVATAYTASCEGCTGITASGVPVEEGMVAMDRSIPLGTNVRITSKSYPAINGIYKVMDRGGAIHEGRVDIAMDSHKDAVAFGVRDVKIEILN